MIYSRAGCEVKLLKRTGDGNTVEAIRLEDGKRKSYHISELKADDGIAEIEKALKNPSEVA